MTSAMMSLIGPNKMKNSSIVVKSIIWSDIWTQRCPMDTFVSCEAIGAVFDDQSA
jgi:hypothetical protein